MVLHASVSCYQYKCRENVNCLFKYLVFSGVFYEVEVVGGWVGRQAADCPTNHKLELLFSLEFFYWLIFFFCYCFIGQLGRTFSGICCNCSLVVTTDCIYKYNIYIVKYVSMVTKHFSPLVIQLNYDFCKATPSIIVMQEPITNHSKEGRG